MRDLLIDITKCDEFKKAKSDRTRPCSKIVESQKNLGITEENFQLPEPWNGHLDRAEILFISSNPSIDENANTDGHEKYPTASWDNKEIISLFETRFNLDNKEKFDYNKQKYWYNINKWTGWILGRDGKKENLLKDHVALTEIVHCKSKKSEKKYGFTPECLETCFNKWLKEILKIFKGEKIIIVGTKLEDYVKSHLEKEYFVGKKFAYTPHPSERKKWLTDAVRKSQILTQLGLI